MLSKPMAVGATGLSAVNAIIRKRFVHLITLVALVAFFVPGVAQSVRAHRFLDGQLDASGLSLFLMMFSAAVQCGLSAFRSTVARPKPLLICLAQFFVVLPSAAGSWGSCACRFSAGASVNRSRLASIW